jgi:hypothetical protein
LIENDFWYLNDTWLDELDLKLEQKAERKKILPKPKKSSPKKSTTKQTTSSSSS